MTTCRNMFLEDDGYCTQCGQNHFKQTKATAAKAAARTQQHFQSEADKKAEIQAAIDADPIYSEAQRTARKVLADFGLSSVSVIFRNKYSNSSCTSTDNWQQIVFGYQMLKDAAQQGEAEYKTLAYLLHYKKLFGREAAHHIALHESAHAIAWHLDKHAAAHGQLFANTLQQLMQAYPFKA